MSGSTTNYRKSTKEIILNYLRMNRGREIAVNEISKMFDFKLNRISNAIKELELSGEIIIDRRPLTKGKYTVICLYGDKITQFASHDREIKSDTNVKYLIDTKNKFDPDQIYKYINILKSVYYTQLKIKILLENQFDNYFDLITKFIQPILYEVGNQWENGDLSIAEEHLITARLEKFIIDLLNTNSKPGSKLILLAPVEQEPHNLVLLVLELLLNERGFRAINLSRTLSVLSLIEFIKKMKHKPDWVLYSVTQESYITNLKTSIRLLRKQTGLNKIRIAIGGQGLLRFKTEDFSDVDKVIKSFSDLEEFLFSI